jgi:acetyl-CoA carboxylase biotin carboxylase subunit
MQCLRLRRIFVANRGEIAVRVIQACSALGIETVAAVSAADRDSLAAALATRAVCIGPARASESYLKPETLVAAALGTGCDAVHPGYGFLSENSAFARMCTDAKLVFIGPSADTIEAMGDKVAALRAATESGVPRVPGSGKLGSISAARRAARKVGYPVLLKAQAGGGGRGMRIARDESELDAAIDAAAAEARAAFGNPYLYLEKLIERARHVEIQILGDVEGNIVHLGERDCSIQRRHQKLIEESPSPFVDATLRSMLGEAAIRLARRVGYVGVGTVEFVIDEVDRHYYFLEMNTRIQVEHPVTEMVSGRDLVIEQIRVAAGQRLSFSQDEVSLHGHAIECRVNAEDAERNFAPTPGRLTLWLPPLGEGVRVDTHCFAGYMISPHYDSLLAKVIVHGETRDEAITRIQGALEHFVVEGVPTTIPFHRRILEHDDFRRGRVTTRWVEDDFLAGVC